MTSSSRRRRKPVLVFAAQAALLGVLLGLLPVASQVYPRVFNAHAEVIYNAALGVLSPERSVRAVALDPSEHKDRRDTRLVGLGPHREPYEWRSHFRIASRGWWPTALALGMVLATPLPARRRLLAAAGAVLLMDVLVLLRVGAVVAVYFAMAEPEPDPRWLRLGEAVIASFNSWVFGLVTVLFTWASLASPAATIDLRLAESWLRGSSRRKESGQGAAGGVGGEGQQHRDHGPEADQQRRDDSLSGPGES